MDVQTFVLGFALIVVALLFRKLIELHYGWLVVAAMSALLGVGATGYLLGHSAGVGAASVEARHLIDAIKFPLGAPEIDKAFSAVSKLPSELREGVTPTWPLLVSILLAVYGIPAFVFLLKIHMARVRRAAEIGVQPEDIKVKIEFS